MTKRKKDWLSRPHRLMVAKIAAEWAKGTDEPAKTFARAAVVIEYYIANGSVKAAEAYCDPAKLSVVHFRPPAA